MTRSGGGVGLVLLVVSLIVGAIVFSSQASRLGLGTSGKVEQSKPVQDAYVAAATFAAAQAERRLSDFQAQHGTFQGVDLRDLPDVALLRADTASYCLEITTGGRRLYERGPGGTVGAQPCA
jgi:hypothetical protein